MWLLDKWTTVSGMMWTQDSSTFSSKGMCKRYLLKYTLSEGDCCPPPPRAPLERPEEAGAHDSNVLNHVALLTTSPATCLLETPSDWEGRHLTGSSCPQVCQQPSTTWEFELGNLEGPRP